MKLKIYLGMLAVGSMMMLPACSSDDPQEQPDVIGPRHEISLSDRQKNDVANVNEFGYRLWTNLQSVDNTHNDFYSPLGVHFIMSMLANGADGETLQQITDLLGSDDLASLNELDKKLLAELPMVDNTVRMSIAGSCWIDKKTTVLESYSNALKDVFGSPVMKFNAGTDEARKAINKWCSDNTGGMISDFLKENPQGMLLLNALFFQGRWEEPFDKSKTVSAPFNNADGSVSTVRMMNNRITTVCAQTERADIAFLDYGNLGYYMKVILPREGYGIKDMTREEYFDDSMTYATRELSISLPRFSVTSDYDKIAEKIADMGYDRIFTNANYARLFGEAAKEVNGMVIRQKSRVDVDESGTRAAAVTDGELTASTSYPFIRLIVDRPFMFTICERSTGVVLFVGKVTKL